MKLSTTIKNTEQLVKTIDSYLNHTSGASHIADSLLDLYSYAVQSKEFAQMNKDYKENLFFVLKQTIVFVTEMQEGIETKFTK